MVLSSAVIADTPAPPSTYTIESDDGQYVFVMLSPLDEELEFQTWNQSHRTEIATVRDLYSQSGLYLADDSSAPLWTVDWYAHSVILFSDGVHLVREGPWAMSGRSEGVSFFADGELLKSYTVSDLVFARWLMPRTASHFMWRKETRVDDEALSYHITTLHLERIAFDARTGEIIRSFSPSQWAFTVLIVLLGFGVYRRSRDRQIREG